MKKALTQLTDGERPFLLVGRDTLPDKPLLLPGSFNPLHEGHRELMLAAEKISGREGVFELALTNVDKPSLDVIEITRRLHPFRGWASVVLTQAPTFIEKAELFPGAWFAMGYDTAVRFIDRDCHKKMSDMLAHFETLKIRFLVAGRIYRNSFHELRHIRIPARFKPLFVPVPKTSFRRDISSTTLRNRIDVS